MCLVQNSAPSVHWLNTKRISNAVGNAASILSNSFLAKPVPSQCCVVDVWRVAHGAVTHCVGNDLLALGCAVTQFSPDAAGTDWLMILKYHRHRAIS